MIKQIKSKKRVSTYGEVYTASREVNDMLDLVGEEASKITSTFLEPACGNGNFIVAILDRKLEIIKLQNVNNFITSMNILRAVASIYGVDIQQDNVEETRCRIKERAIALYDALGCPTGHFFDAWVEILDLILETNVLCGNTLTARLMNGVEMKFSEWTISDKGWITRDEVSFQNMLDGVDDDANNHTIYQYNINDYIYKTA